MKHSLKGNKIVQYLGTVLLALIVLLSSVAAVPPIVVNSKSVSQNAISKYILAQQNPTLSVGEKIKTAIDVTSRLAYREHLN